MQFGVYDIRIDIWVSGLYILHQFNASRIWDRKISFDDCADRS